VIFIFLFQDFSYWEYDQPFDDTLTGVICSVIAAILNSINYIMDKKICYEFHSYTILFVTGVFSTVISPILMAISGDKFYMDIVNFTLFFLFGASSFFGFYFTHKSIEAHSLLNNSSLNYIIIGIVYFNSIIVLEEPFTLNDVIASCIAIIVNYYTKIRLEDCENEDNL
jgi:drug/metabolite transporter (DMT)-like permease